MAETGSGDGKILGMPKAGAIALFAGGGLLLFLWWQHSQGSSSSGTGTNTGAPGNVYLTLPGHWKKSKKPPKVNPGGPSNG
jgi:hypothetical protein